MMGSLVDAASPPGRRAPHSRALVASTASQKASLAELVPVYRRHALYEGVTLSRRESYFDVSCRPITKCAEDDMELLSDLATWGEALLNVWADGAYNCARCKAGLYSSDDKWRGPCPWPSWRREDGNVEALEVLGYNRYACEVCELYCAKCSLFLGHRFEDAVARGDTHAGARFRH